MFMTLFYVPRDAACGLSHSSHSGTLHVSCSHGGLHLVKVAGSAPLHASCVMDDSLISLLSLLSQGELEESLDSLNASTGPDSSTSFSDTDDPPARSSANLPPGLEPTLGKPLHKDTNLTTWACCLHIMRYCLCHRLTKTAVSDLLGLVIFLLAKTTPTLLYKFKKTFLSLYEDMCNN